MSSTTQRIGGGTAHVLAGTRTRSLLVLVLLILVAFAAVEGLLLGLGVLVTHVFMHGAGHRAELGFEHDVAAHRTSLLDAVTRWGTRLGSTTTVLVLTAVGCLLLTWRGHGPRLPTFLVVAVAGETLLFLIAQLVLHRMRPPILHLDPAPPTSSFPSGHTAATLALWGALAIGLARTRPRHHLLGVAWGLAVVLPLFVLSARLYRGMHWPSDVASSLIFTAIWLVLLTAILLPRRRDPASASRR